MSSVFIWTKGSDVVSVKTFGKSILYSNVSLLYFKFKFRNFFLISNLTADCNHFIDKYSKNWPEAKWKVLYVAYSLNPLAIQELDASTRRAIDGNPILLLDGKTLLTYSDYSMIYKLAKTATETGWLIQLYTTFAIHPTKFRTFFAYEKVSHRLITSEQVDSSTISVDFQIHNVPLKFQEAVVTCQAIEIPAILVCPNFFNIHPKLYTFSPELCPTYIALSENSVQTVTYNGSQDSSDIAFLSYLTEIYQKGQHKKEFPYFFEDSAMKLLQNVSKIIYPKFNFMRLSFEEDVDEEDSEEFEKEVTSLTLDALQLQPKNIQSRLLEIKCSRLAYGKQIKDLIKPVIIACIIHAASFDDLEVADLASTAIILKELVPVYDSELQFKLFSTLHDINCQEILILPKRISKKDPEESDSSDDWSISEKSYSNESLDSSLNSMGSSYEEAKVAVKNIFHDPEKFVCLLELYVKSELINLKTLKSWVQSMRNSGSLDSFKKLLLNDN